MARSDQTSMGGEQCGFRTTHWSIVQAAKTDDGTRRNAVVGNLTATYWKPVYCYLRRRGFNNEEAKDLTQDFFCEIVFGTGFVQNADRQKGRFRTFLLTALVRYAASDIRHKMRIKARPRGGVVAVDFDDLESLQMPEAANTAEQAFCFRWAADLLDEVIAEIREEYCNTGRSAYWELFRQRVLVPILEKTGRPSSAQLCKELGIDNASQADNIVVTVKRRFRTILKRRLRKLVRSDAEMEEELNDIFEILSRSRAG